MNMVPIKVRYLDDADQAIPLPAYETADAAGMDLRANFPADARDTLTLEPSARVLVPTGLAIEIPKGFEVQIRPRSGLALKHGIILPNSPGTIDADYRGPLGVILMNLGAAPFAINHGDRIAQMVIAPVVQAQWEMATELSETKRGSGGFGSTGSH